MSDNKPGEKQAAKRDEAFLERWSRLKSEARVADASTSDGQGSPATDQESAGSSGQDSAREVADQAHAPLPDPATLDEDADYSAFLAPGIDDALRRKALRKLFHSPKFNICDGLDDYCEDFTQFEKLGDVVTFDMRHRLENAADKVATSLEGDESGHRTARAEPARIDDSESVRNDESAEAAGTGDGDAPTGAS